MAEQKKLDRPDREKTVSVVEAVYKRHFPRSINPECATNFGKEVAAKIIPLFPDNNTSCVGLENCCDLEARLEEAKREERERIKTAKVICLCGSTRFTREMLIKQWELTKQGYIVVSWCALPDDYRVDALNGDTSHIGDKEGVKELVDELHKRKIDLCDEVFVLNIDGYIGESTRSEIDYALKIGRPVNYWQALKEEKQ